MVMNPWRWCLVAVLLAATVGCRTSPRTRVWGEVSFDGRPVAKGTIEFIPAEGTGGTSAGGAIEDGSYDIPAKQGPLTGGTYRVEITALAKTGRTRPNVFDPNGPLLDDYKCYIPACYNSKSVLKVTLSAPKENKHDFRLVSSRRPPQ
jgi:hypothetical protein